MTDWETPPPSDYMEDDLKGPVYGTSRLEEIDEEDDR